MHKLFITGGSGYVGAMLVREFAERPDVEAIFAIDKEPASELYAGHKKVTFVQTNMADTENWLDKAKAFAPDIVVHTAWQIREMYGEKKKQWRWNIDGSDAVFDFAFSTSSVKKLIHFSTVASYGAFADNEIDKLFTEKDAFRKTDYLYAEEKRITEEHLEERYAAAKAKGNTPQVFVVRPAAITGPRGRYMRIRFGLQAALSGQLKENFIHKLISAMVSFVPITKKWCRQFIHEDDVVSIVRLLSFENLKGVRGLQHLSARTCGHRAGYGKGREQEGDSRFSASHQARVCGHVEPLSRKGSYVKGRMEVVLVPNRRRRVKDHQNVRFPIHV